MRDPAVRETLKRISVFLTDVLSLDFCGEPAVRHAFGALRTNCVGFGRASASALYPVVALMSHSCRPNLEAMPQAGRHFGFRVATAIAKGDQLTIAYLPWLSHRLSLRRELRAKWLFECRCSRCEDATEAGTFMSSPLCGECEGGWLGARAAALRGRRMDVHKVRGKENGAPSGGVGRGGRRDVDNR